MSTNKHIAIIGAGLAGATLATKLMSAGCDVTVYEKSRGTGGRIASCRLGDTPEGKSVDLGAPFLSPASDEFRQWLAQHPYVFEWSPATFDFKGAACDLNRPHFIATPRQSSLTRELLKGADLRTSMRVGYLWPERDEEHARNTEQHKNKQSRVLLRDENGKRLGCYDAAIVATPAKQAAPLLEAVPRFVRQAETATPTMSWVLVLQISTPQAITAELIEGLHPLLLRCIKDSAKPGRACSKSSDTNSHTSTEVWVLEATSEWSELNRDSHSVYVAEQLTSAFLSLLIGTFNAQPTIITERVHRWLYSRHINQDVDPHLTANLNKSLSLHPGYLWDADTKIGACGDWLESGDLEGAWLSANKLADKLIAELNLI